MNKEKNTADKITNLSEKAPITSPFSQENLVSKVNALTFKTCANSLSNPHNKNFNNEKGLTLSYKFVVEELVQINGVKTLYELYTKISSPASGNSSASPKMSPPPWGLRSPTMRATARKPAHPTATSPRIWPTADG